MPRCHSTFHIPRRRAPQTEALARALSGLQDNYKHEPVSPRAGLTRAERPTRETARRTLVMHSLDSDTAAHSVLMSPCRVFSNPAVKAGEQLPVCDTFPWGLMRGRSLESE